MKPGYKTSEFWFTLVSFIFSGLFLLGIIGDFSHKEELIRDVSHAVESCILIGGQLLILYNYIKNRSVIKNHYLDLEEKNNESSISTTNNKRHNSTRSRKTNTKYKK